MDAIQQLIVVVEDDSGMRQALQRLLQLSRYRYLAFESAEALLVANGASDAACLILDVQLPGLSGIDLYARLGVNRPPAVFITSHDCPEVQHVQAGGAPLLRKPFLSKDLLDAIALLIRTKAP